MRGRSAIHGLSGVFATAASAALSSLLSGCNTMDGPEVISLTSSDYPAIFEACLDQTRDAGMPAVMADRTIGVIESKPRHIGSFVEPWRLDSSGLEQTANATLQFERRRVRFEFVPANLDLPAPAGDRKLTGPMIPGSIPDEKRFDLEHYQGPIELRAWVYIERGFTPGLNPGRWSLALTTTWTDAARGDNRRGADETTRSRTEWTPIARDEAMERTLLARVQAQFERGREVPDPASGANAATAVVSLVAPERR